MLATMLSLCYLNVLYYHFQIFLLQTSMGPVLIAVNSFDQVQSKTGVLQSVPDNEQLQTIIQTVTNKLASSSASQVIVLR